MEYLIDGRNPTSTGATGCDARQWGLIAILVFAVVASVVLLAGVPAARAADETMPISKVTPGMVGYAKTVTTGTVVTTFTVEVLSVLEGEGMTSGDLILFRASGPVIGQTGGVVPGMSGSPIYLTDPDDGHEKVAGAISYGYDWAEPTLALATPIDEMLGLLQLSGMTTVLPKVYAPADGRPVNLGGGRILKSISVNGSSGDTVTCRPLGTVLSVAGINANSRLYKKLEKVMSRKGFLMTSVGGGGVARADVSTATLEPGASLAAALMTGDTTMAGIGTVTYPDGSRIVGWGHPMLWTGPAQLYMMTGYVHTVFPAENGGIGFKLASAGDTTGTVLQDRAKAIGGRTGQFPQETSMTVSAANSDDPTSTVKHYQIAKGAMDDWFYAWYCSTTGLINTNDSVFDGIRGGTADTTWTISGRDCEGTPFELTFDNKISDPYDISMSALNDVSQAIDSILMNGYEPVTIDNISYAATMTATRQEARITNVSFLGRQPVRGRTATVRVSFVPWGGRTDQSVDATLAVPKNFYVPYSDISVSSSEYDYYDDMWWDYYEDWPMDYGSEDDSDWTIQQYAEDYEGQMRNNEIDITYSDVMGRSVSKTVQTSLVQSGGVDKMLSSITMRRAPATVVYGSRVRFVGVVGPWVRRPKVKLIEQTYGSAEATVSAETTGSLYGAYSILYRPASTGVFRTYFPGTGSWLDASSTAAKVSVKVKTTLVTSRSSLRRGSAVRLFGAVRPTHAGGVTIQWLYGRRWVTLRNVALDGSSNYSTNWVPGRPGLYRLRTRRLGDGSHLGNVSQTRLVRVL